MLLIDAVVALGVIKYCGDDAVKCFLVMCGLAFLRVLPRLNKVLKCFEMGMVELLKNEEEE